jgi:RimJ/RimL family protein N-acetyltransferase
MIEVAEGARFHELDALCHVEHRASAHVLEKCGFAPIGMVAGQQFPNLSAPQAPALHYRRALNA